MATVQQSPRLFKEIANFLASRPTAEELLGYRPSEPIQQRARELLAKLKMERLSDDEQRELDQFEYAETLMRLVKARLHANKGPQP